MSRARFILFVGLSARVLTGCASESPSREARPPLRVGVAFAITAPSPYEWDGLGALIHELVFGSLVRHDRTATSGPGAPTGDATRPDSTVDDGAGPRDDLAERKEWSVDGRRLTLHLRPGTRFADGTPLTSRDVIDTYDRASKLGCFGSTELRSIRAVDAMTVEVAPTSPFVLPEALTLGVERSGSSEHIGAGPYLLESHDAERLVLRANPNYRGAPHRLERIEFHRFESTAETWSRLLGKEVDLVTYVPWTKYDIFRTVPSIRRVSSLSRAVYLIDLSRAHAPFDRPDVRRALSLALDRQAMIDGPSRGHGRRAAGCVWPESEDFDATVEPDPYDPQDALKRLGAVGVTLDADGALEWKGTPLTIRLAYPKGHVAEEEQALLVERQLEEIGIAVEVVGATPPAFEDLPPFSGSTMILTIRHATTDLLHDRDMAALVARSSPATDGAASPATAQARHQEVRALQRRLREEPPAAIYLYWMERLAIIDDAFCGLPRLPDGPESALHLIHPCAPGEADGSRFDEGAAGSPAARP